STPHCIPAPPVFLFSASRRPPHTTLFPYTTLFRSFANMTAGHILILSLTGLIIVFETAWVALGFVPMTLFIYVIEILVAFLQAYIFTLLSALFVGMALHQEH